MKIAEENNRILIHGIKDFDLDHTFDNGQCFRWNRELDGSYTGAAFKRVLNIQHHSGSIILNNVNSEDYGRIWSDYLDLNRDYGKIKEMLSQKDEAMKNAIAYGGGMRILKQDLWETVISFIVSQNNNIPRIKKCIEGLCFNYGKSIGIYKGKEYFAFPEPEALACLEAEELDTCRLGYRAKYIVETARQIVSDRAAFDRLHETSAEDAYEYLLRLSGVGPKVANCILLFGLGKTESFPLDVWIKRVMSQVYHIEEGNVKKMKAYAAKHFGEYGGIAQQYLFYYTREISKSKI